MEGTVCLFIGNISYTLLYHIYLQNLVNSKLISINGISVNVSRLLHYRDNLILCILKT